MGDDLSPAMPRSTRPFVAVLLVLASVPAHAGPASSVPTMGWNSWYALGKKAGWPITDQASIQQSAEALVSSGLSKWYKYVVIDDSWENDHREPDGSLLPNPTKFPDGMPAMVKFVRSRGMEVGLYTTPGQFTCSGAAGGGEPGSLGHVKQDMDLWVGTWGVRYIKDCVCNTTHALRQHAYKDMAKAINETGKDVVYECDPFMEQPWITAQGVCDLWSVSDDIADDFDAWTHQIDLSYAAGVIPKGGPGGWNSFDYLQIGNGGQSYTEYASQFSMFAMIAAPIFIGSDVRNMTAETLAIYSADEVIQVSQDPLGVPAMKISSSGTVEVWARPLKQHPDSGPLCAIALFNRGAEAQVVAVSWSQLAVLGNQWQQMTTGAVRDLWKRQAVGVLQGGINATVQSHAVVVLRVSVL